jgi:CheY-like chemotaxis protein
MFLVPPVQMMSNEVAGTREEESTSSARSRPVHVLVVDDDRDSADSLSALLKLAGGKSSTAYDGTSALETIFAYRPDVVLLDLSMPGVNGFEVALQIRKYPELRKIMLIAVTGWGRNEDLRRSHQAGFDHHLVKPVDIDVLLRMLGLGDEPRSAPPFELSG